MHGENANIPRVQRENGICYDGKHVVLEWGNIMLKDVWSFSESTSPC